MYKVLLIVMPLLLLITLGSGGCSQETARVQDAPMGEHECDKVEVLADSSYDHTINIDWSY